MLDFTEIYDEHISRVYGYVAYRVSTRADAEDITQNTFMRAFVHWQDFDDRRSQITTWLIAIARNLIVDHYRAQSRQRPGISLTDVPETKLPVHPDPEPRGYDASPELAAALGELPDRDRELLALRFGADLTGPEIADLTGLTVANVHQILSRSLRRLRERLDGSHDRL